MLGRGGIFSRNTEPTGPVRPSTFRETQEERTEAEPRLDYPQGTDEDYKLDRPENYGFHDFGDRPVGVYVTAPIPGDRPLIDWSSGTVTVDTVNATQIAGADRNRTRFYIRNLDAVNAVILIHGNTDQSFTGFTLPAGQPHEMLHTGPIWVRAVTAPVTVTYQSEITLPEVATER
jgi:hypothetical protein